GLKVSGAWLRALQQLRLLGGTVSELTGGKFANGAETAAYGQLFNGESKYWSNGLSRNPFKIIAKEFPKWWSSSETEDLRNGLDSTLDVATIPYKSLRLPVDIKDYMVAGRHA